jgi:hypothetical protein
MFRTGAICLPARQRRGLARAVSLDALRALRGAGATTAQVVYGSEAARTTCTSMSFTNLAADTIYRREPR